MSRDPNDKVSLTLRMPERLRQRIEDRALQCKRSLNMQIIAELEDLSAQTDLVRARFGTDEIAAFMQALSSCFVLAQMQTGKSFASDPDTMDRALIATQAILSSFRARNGAPEAKSPVEQTVADAMSIANYAGKTFFERVDVPEPEWLKAALERLRQPVSTDADNK